MTRSPIARSPSSWSIVRQAWRKSATLKTSDPLVPLVGDDRPGGRAVGPGRPGDRRVHPPGVRLEAGDRLPGVDHCLRGDHRRHVLGGSGGRRRGRGRPGSARAGRHTRRACPQGPRRPGGEVLGVHLGGRGDRRTRPRRPGPAPRAGATCGMDRPSLASSWRTQSRANRADHSSTVDSSIPRVDQDGMGLDSGVDEEEPVEEPVGPPLAVDHRPEHVRGSWRRRWSGRGGGSGSGCWPRASRGPS